jgi:acyl carrier protein
LSTKNPTVEEIVADVLDMPVEEITDETSPDTTARWDSLQHLNIIMALEEAFRVSFTTDEITQMLSVGIIKILLHERSRA